MITIFGSQYNCLGLKWVNEIQRINIKHSKVRGKCLSFNTLVNFSTKTLLLIKVMKMLILGKYSDVMSNPIYIQGNKKKCADSIN